jgi:hypothetical protein
MKARMKANAVVKSGVGAAAAAGTNAAVGVMNMSDREMREASEDARYRAMVMEEARRLQKLGVGVPPSAASKEVLELGHSGPNGPSSLREVREVAEEEGVAREYIAASGGGRAVPVKATVDLSASMYRSAVQPAERLAGTGARMKEVTYGDDFHDDNDDDDDDDDDDGYSQLDESFAGW